jgi:hypothetical protein
MNAHTRPSRLCQPLLVATVSVAAALHTLGQEWHLIPEHAPTVQGAWGPLDPAQTEFGADGSLLVPGAATNEFFRLRIEPGRTAQSGRTLLLADVPTNVLNRALTLLQNAVANANNPDNDQGWTDAVLGPTVNPVYAAAFNNGPTPAYYKFKVLRGTNPPPPRGDVSPNAADRLVSGPGLHLGVRGALRFSHRRIRHARAHGGGTASAIGRHAQRQGAPLRRYALGRRGRARQSAGQLGRAAVQTGPCGHRGGPTAPDVVRRRQHGHRRAIADQSFERDLLQLVCRVQK